MFITALQKLWVATVLLISLYIFHTKCANGPRLNSNVNLGCGYMTCPPVKPDMVNIHLIAHSHDDVGWLKTVDQYYYGLENNIQRACVKCILDTVIQELLKDPQKRFIYAEMVFFFKWWSQQTPKLQEQVKMLVNEGRLEFVNGAWSMNDEATTHYQSIIDQYALGLKRLNDTFGKCSRPRIGWQIDPFGHSFEQASIFEQIGFDGLFFGRIDYREKEQRLENKKAEFLWRMNDNLNDTSSYIFTSILYNLYQAPPGFCFDSECFDRLNNGIFKYVYPRFLEFISNQLSGYRTNHILVTMGGDFHFQNAKINFENMDLLIQYVNALQSNGSKLNLLYSTPSCYLKNLEEADLTWSYKNADDDFFPYASQQNAYWTGFFTSRPTLKYYERIGNNFLQICKQLSMSIDQVMSNVSTNLNRLREAMGILQHHDAITGTEKQKVADDYAKILSEGITACSKNTQMALQIYHTKVGSHSQEKSLTEEMLDFKICPLLNISHCDVSEKESRFIVTIYNPLGVHVDEYVRLPVPGLYYGVRDYEGKSLDVQYLPIPEDVRKLNKYKTANISKYELVFEASQIPPTGFKSYYISKISGKELVPITTDKTPEDDFNVGNDHITLTFNKHNQLISIRSDNISNYIQQHFLSYLHSNGFVRSGAYLSRPNIFKSYKKVITATVYRGPLVEEIHQKFNDWISQVIRVYRKQKYAEFEWLIGPIPGDDEKGREIVTEFKTNIKSGDIFYTDSNGRRMMKRQRNHRSSFHFTEIDEPIAFNYYPVTTRIAIEDNNSRLAILTDRSQGGTSKNSGSLELMLHRRLFYDDSKGVDEPLDEIVNNQGLVVRGKHHLIFGKAQNTQSPTTQSLERFTQLQKLLKPWKFFSAISLQFDEWQQKYEIMDANSNSGLPKNIHLLTMEPWNSPNEALVRFEHIFDKGEDPEFSKPAIINIKKIFGGQSLLDARETTLDGSAWLSDKNRLKFYSTWTENTKPESGSKNLRHVSNKIFMNTLYPKIKTVEGKEDTLGETMTDTEKFIVKLEPMQIRTFIIYFNITQ